MANNQAKKSIIIFSTAYLPLVGGAEMAVKEITDRLPNYHFDLITARIQLDLDKFGKIGNLNVYRLGLGAKLDKFLLPFLGLWKAIQLEKKNHYSLIWSIMASQAGLTAVFFKFFYPNKNILLNIQEGDPEEHLKRYAGGFNFLYTDYLREKYGRTGSLRNIKGKAIYRPERHEEWKEISIDSNNRDVQGNTERKFNLELFVELLPDCQREYARETLIYGNTYKEAGKNTGVSESRVSQVMRGVKKLLGLALFKWEHGL